MARTTNFLFLILAMFVSVISSKVGSAADVLTKNYLMNNVWGPDIGELGLYFKFTPDNTFKTDSNYEGGDFYSGTYQITGNKLTLKISS